MKRKKCHAGQHENSFFRYRHGEPTLFSGFGTIIDFSDCYCCCCCIVIVIVVIVIRYFLSLSLSLCLSKPCHAFISIRSHQMKNMLEIKIINNYAMTRYNENEMRTVKTCTCTLSTPTMYVFQSARARNEARTVNISRVQGRPQTREKKSVWRIFFCALSSFY